MPTHAALPHHVEVIVIGGSQAGLAMSYWLKQHQVSHAILERAHIAENWRSQRWDSFTLVTPNSSIRLPGFAYSGDDPSGYMGRDTFVAYLEAYAAHIQAPLCCGVEVQAVRSAVAGAGFSVETADQTILTPNVVIATGILQQPRLPQPLSAALPSGVLQLHSSHYQNPNQLPEGAVLVVGTGQSGCQIAEELHHSGRKAFLSVGRSGRIPRRYRGKDIYFWVGQAGLFTSTPDRFSNHAHVSGAQGGHDLNLYHFARQGITLLGRLQSVSGTKLQIAPDLLDNLAYADTFESEYLRQVDEYVAATGFDAPLQPGDRPRPEEQYTGELLTELDLAQADIRTVIWATGYRYDFSWVEFPVFDSEGFPRQDRGITAVPGLYFLGMNWRTPPRSAFVGSVGGEAEVIAQHIAARQVRRIADTDARSSNAGPISPDK